MTQEPAASFAVLLRHYRVAAGLSQEALGERSGLSTRAISDLERGERRTPYRETVRQLADALEMSATNRARLEAAVDRKRSVGGAALVDPVSRAPTLPAQTTSIIGRQQEIRTANALLRRPELRLLTLVGPPGIGKTRLALAVAADLADVYVDGVVFTSLAPLSDARLVATAILQAHGVSDIGARPAAERLVEVLRDRQVLCVLDNFEQVVDAAPIVGRLLEACPSLAILATSRIPLHLRGEYEFPVPPLALPHQEDATVDADTIRTLADAPAVALFLERARAVQPGFSLTRENAADIVDICHRLDGLPLAIELAAARTKVLTPRAMRNRLGRRFDFLTDGARDAPAHHRTLREAIAWSHDLLGTNERMLFRRLGVFLGGSTLEAIAQVCDADGTLGLDPFDGVAALIHHSLVQQHAGADDEPRFTMLETLREFALEQLASTGELQRVQARLASYVLALAEEAEPHLYTGARWDWLQRLSDEQENIRAVLTWALAQDDPEMGLQLVSALWLWFLRRLLVEGRQWAESLLGHPGATRPTSARAGAMFVAGHFAWLQGDVATMRARMEEVVAIRRDLNDAVGLGQALPFLALAIDDDEAAARRLAEEGVVRSREVGSAWDLALALINLGRIAATWGKDDEARTPLEEALARCDETGDAWLHALALNSLGTIAWRAGDYEKARAAFTEALASFRAIEDRRNTTQALTNLGYTALAIGELDWARETFTQSIAFGREHGDRFNVVACLRGFGLLGRELGMADITASLFATAKSLFAATGATHWPAERLGAEVPIDEIRRLLGEAAFDRAWTIGRGRSVEEALTLVQATMNQGDVG